jgi:hypothetical protein
MTLSITALKTIVSFMLSVTNKPIMLGVLILTVVMVNVVAPFMPSYFSVVNYA